MKTVRDFLLYMTSTFNIPLSILFCDHEWRKAAHGDDGGVCPRCGSLEIFRMAVIIDVSHMKMKRRIIFPDDSIFDDTVVFYLALCTALCCFFSFMFLLLSGRDLPQVR